MRGVHGAGAASTHVAGQHLVGTARRFASWTPVIERRAVFLDLAHRTPGLGYKNGSMARFQHTNIMPLYYLFDLGEIEPRSFGEEVFLYPGPVSRHNLVSPLLSFWYRVPEWIVATMVVDVS